MRSQLHRATTASRASAPRCRRCSRGEREQRVQPPRQVGGAAVEGDPRLAQARRDLGQARVVGHDRHDPAGGRLGRDHPERLGQHRWHDHRIRQGHQPLQLGVIHRAREDDARRCLRLELGPGVSEADDDEPHIRMAGRDLAPGVEQQVDALLAHQLAEVEDEALQALRGRRRRRRPQPARPARPPAPRPAASSSASAWQRAPAGGKLVGVHAGRHDPQRLPVAAVAEELLGDRDDVARAGEHGRRAARATSRAISASRGRPRIAYSSSEPCTLTA